MIDKILHSFEPIDYSWRYLFDDFAFMRWDKKLTNQFKVLYDHGGIFINNVRPIKNFYNQLDQLKFNLLEKQIEKNKIALDISVMACEKNFIGCRLILEELDKKPELQIINEYFKKERESFNVLPWYENNVKHIGE